MRIAVSLLLAVVLVPSAASAHCNFPNEKETETRLCFFLRGPIEQLTDYSQASMVAVFGRPVSTDERRLPNPHDPDQIDVFAHLEFDKAEVSIRFLKGDQSRGVPWSILLADDRVALRYGLRIGTAVADWVQTLGEPGYRFEGRWRFTGIANTTLDLTIVDGKVRSLYWSPYQG